MRRTIGATVLLAIWALPFAGSAAQIPIDLASVITKADAQTVLGEPVRDPQAKSEEGADGYYSRCNYYSENPGRSLVVRVRQISPGQLEPKKQLEEMTAGNNKFKAIPGVGDQAALLREGPDKGPGHAVMLYVAKDGAFITIAISGIDDEKVATEKTKTLAKKIIGKL